MGRFSDWMLGWQMTWRDPNGITRGLQGWVICVCGLVIIVATILVFVLLHRSIRKWIKKHFVGRPDPDFLYLHDGAWQKPKGGHLFTPVEDSGQILPLRGERTIALKRADEREEVYVKYKYFLHGSWYEYELLGKIDMGMRGFWAIFRYSTPISQNSHEAEDQVNDAIDSCIEMFETEWQVDIERMEVDFKDISLHVARND